MSTPPGPETAAPLPHVGDARREIRIYGHSPLLYWWPVWATGFIMAILTFIDNGRMVIVPNHTQVGQAEEGTAMPVQVEDDGTVTPLENQPKIALDKRRMVLVGEPGKVLPVPHLHMSHNKNLGVLFATVLLLIIFISNVPLRGLWSAIIVLFVFLLAVILALPGVDLWPWILEKVFRLHIFINLGGYVFISLVLFIIWAVTVFAFDHRTYLVVSSGQVKMCLAVGAGEQVMDTSGMTFSKKQDDLFRHWIVGLGSGDLIIHRTGQEKDIDIPNVLFVGSKIREIERLVKEREVV